VLLADELIKRARAHAIGQGPGAVSWVVAARDGLEEAHIHHGDTEARRNQVLKDLNCGTDDRLCNAARNMKKPLVTPCLRVSVVNCFSAVLLRIAQYLRLLRRLATRRLASEG